MADDGAVAGGWGEDGLLDQASEAVADAFGGAAIETEDVLVEVGLQMLLADRTVMGAKKPAFGQAEDQVDGRQAEHGIAPGRAEIDRVVGVAGRAQPGIALPAVGGHRGGRGHVGGEEGLQACGRGVGDGREPQPAEPALAALAGCRLDRTGDHRLAGGAAAGLARPLATQQRLVGLDPRRERRPARGDHGLADLVQPAPGGLIAAEAHLALQLHGGDPAFARGHQPDGEKPARQPGLGLLEDRAGQERMLPAAGRALFDQPPPMVVGHAVAAAGAAKARRPALGEQMGSGIGRRSRTAPGTRADPAAARP